MFYCRVNPAIMGTTDRSIIFVAGACPPTFAMSYVFSIGA
jgi:hypothetical protein